MDNTAGLVCIMIFCLIVFIIGVAAAKFKTHQAMRSKALYKFSRVSTAINARRDISLFGGVAYLVVLLLGAGFFFATSEKMYTDGLVWCQAPIGYSLSLFFSGEFYARKMRQKVYVTMLDPFQERYGTIFGAALIIPALIGHVMYSSAILRALGTTFSVILDVDAELSSIIGAVFSICYTVFGGLYSVVYVNVVMLFCVVIGIVIPIPSMYSSDYVSLAANITDTSLWMGEIHAGDVGRYTDQFILLMLGGIPWQPYYQIVLAAKTSKTAQHMSYMAGVACLLCIFPPAFIGFIAKGADWDAAGFNSTIMMNHPQLVLPASIKYLSSPWASFFGLCALTAGILGSLDCSIISVASMFTHNIYRKIIRQKAKDAELMFVFRISGIATTALSCFVGFAVHSIYDLFYLCSDLVYVILFPQLTCVLFVPFVNTYGVLLGCIVGLVLRLIAGENSIYMPSLIEYPFYDKNLGNQRFPFRTFSMLMNLWITLLVSHIANKLFSSGKLPRKYDIANISERHFKKREDDSKLETSLGALYDSGLGSLSSQTGISESDDEVKTARG